MWQELLKQLEAGEIKALARSISYVENEQEGYEQFLESLQLNQKSSIIGITGPPGVGKSTLVDALTGFFIKSGKKVAILCVDPSSPFNLGAVLGDRIRMSEWYTNPSVFIRSLATRGSMGGLHPKIMEITDLLKSASYDYIIVETVGVGQSEIEIAGLADITVVVLVPEYGDEIQTMKAGLMEIGSIFVINKNDRPDADLFEKNLRLMLAAAFNNPHEIAILKTIASQKKGIKELYGEIIKLLENTTLNEKRNWLLTEKAWHIIQQNRMREIDKNKLRDEIKILSNEGKFNLYQFIKKYQT